MMMVYEQVIITQREILFTFKNIKILSLSCNSTTDCKRTSCMCTAGDIILEAQLLYYEQLHTKEMRPYYYHLMLHSTGNIHGLCLI